jgi:predicted nucleic acid-binding protein
VIALLDNTVLSNFTAIGRADLVRLALGEDAATSEAAWAELQAGIRSGKLPVQDWSWLPILPLTASEEPLYNLFAERLNAGEASCLAIAASRGCRVFTDDRDARRLAAERKIPVSGTLGLLLRLIDLRALSLAEGDALLGRMIAAGYRSPMTSLQELL